MTSREQFEAAISASPFERSVARWPNDPTKHSWPGAYKDLNVDLAWCMWQASRKQALEEAIAICEKQGTHEEDMGRSKEAFGCDLCVEVLANLANPQGEPS